MKYTVKRAAGVLLVVSGLVFLTGCAGDRQLQEERARAKMVLGNSLIQEGQQRAGLKMLLEAEAMDPRGDIGSEAKDLLNEIR